MRGVYLLLEISNSLFSFSGQLWKNVSKMMTPAGVSKRILQHPSGARRRHDVYC